MQHEAPILRVATRADVPAMLAIYAPFVTESTVSFRFSVPSLAAYTEHFETVTGSGYPWLVCEEAGQVAGFCYFHKFLGPEGYDWSAETTVYLAETYRGRGIGVALYSAIEELGRRLGYFNFYALVDSPNPASDALHQRMGYEQAAFFPHIGNKFGHWRDVTFYHKTLVPYTEHPAPPLRLDALPPQEVMAVLAACAPGAVQAT